MAFHLSVKLSLLSCFLLGSWRKHIHLLTWLQSWLCGWNAASHRFLQSYCFGFHHHIFRYSFFSCVVVRSHFMKPAGLMVILTGNARHADTHLSAARSSGFPTWGMKCVFLIPVMEAESLILPPRLNHIPSPLWGSSRRRSMASICVLSSAFICSPSTSLPPSSLSGRGNLCRRFVLNSQCDCVTWAVGDCRRLWQQLLLRRRLLLQRFLWIHQIIVQTDRDRQEVSTGTTTNCSDLIFICILCPRTRHPDHNTNINQRSDQSDHWKNRRGHSDRVSNKETRNEDAHTHYTTFILRRMQQVIRRKKIITRWSL